MMILMLLHTVIMMVMMLHTKDLKFGIRCSNHEKVRRSTIAESVEFVFHSQTNSKNNLMKRSVDPPSPSRISRVCFSFTNKLKKEIMKNSVDLPLPSSAESSELVFCSQTNF